MNPWLLLVLMSLTTYRITRLCTEDTFPPMLWVRDRLAGGWRDMTEPEQLKEHRAVVVDGGDGVPQIYIRRWKRSPFWLAELISCPWCASGWVALGVVTATWGFVGLDYPVLWWPAVWALGALLAAQEWS